MALIVAKQKKRKRKKTMWMQPFLGCRFTHDAYHALLQELDEKAYKNFLRMTDSHFNCCSTKCGQVLQRQNMTMRLSIAPEERLAVTLRYLATNVTPNFQHFTIIQ